MTVKKKHLPAPALEMEERFRSSSCLLKTSHGRTQTIEDSLAHEHARTGNQNVISVIGRDGVSRHVGDLK